MADNHEDCVNNSLSTFFICYETVNIALSAAFIAIFSFRFHRLKCLNAGVKYEKFFPRLRVILSIIYIILSVVVLSFNIVVGLFPPSQAYNYILQGGGGACMNSIVLVIQLMVLRLELIKQQPYTKFHLAYFIVLAVFSIIRYVLSFQFDCYLEYTPNRLANLVLSGILALLSVIELVYWIFKSHSLPQFVHPSEIDMDSYLENRSLNHQILLQNSLQQSEKDHFPYLISFVNVENGQLRIVLETLKKKEMEKLFQLKNYQSPLKKELIEVNQQLTQHQSKVASTALYTLEQICQFYVICGSYCLIRQKNIGRLDVRSWACQLSLLLEDITRSQHFYQPQILRHLRIPEDEINEYRQFHRQQQPQRHIREWGACNSCCSSKDNETAIYAWFTLYNNISIDDRHFYYFKIELISVEKTVYLSKSIQQLQQLHQELSSIISKSHRFLKLPTLPHHSFGEYFAHHSLKQQLETYCNLLCNDHELMSRSLLRCRLFELLGIDSSVELIPRFYYPSYRDLEILPGQIVKEIVKKKCVIVYSFKLLRGQREVAQIAKTYSDFAWLHQEIKRWVNNTQTACELFDIPSKLNLGTEAKRHIKFVKYLHHLITIPEINKAYAFNLFMNPPTGPSDHCSDRTDLPAHNKSRVTISRPTDKDIELANSKVKEESKSSHFSARFDDLAQQTYSEK